MRLLLENLPVSLLTQQKVLESCLKAMSEVMPLEAIILFGSHARNEARMTSDIDLCVVTCGAEDQIKAAQRLRRALIPVWPRPSLTLLPISPGRLAEKRECGDEFFRTLLGEGVVLATKS